VLVLFSASLHARETATACGHHDYPPWNWKQNNRIVGVCAEITETLFSQLGVEVDLSYIGPWKRCQKEIESGQIDINICSFINTKRRHYSKFVETPMAHNEIAIFVKKGNDFPFKKWSDLKNKIGITMLGVSIGKEFDDFVNKDIKMVRVSSNRQVFGLLERERADFTPFGRYSGKALLKTMGQEQNFVALETPVLKGKLHISMSSKSNYIRLLPKIETLIQQPGYNNWVNGLLQKYSTIYADENTVSILETDDN
jgi:polar amino acid transport system substrate-binding protein